MVGRSNDGDSITNFFLGLIPLKDATAQTLYSNVVNFFNDNGIPYKDNLIGFAADGANSMLGEHHSLSSLLQADIPHLFVVKCICHSYALCASNACSKLPRSIEELARDIYSYFSCSPKRVGELEEFQKFVNVKPHKILHPSQTRWLSLHMVVSRLLEQYNALKLYFTSAVLDDKLVAADTILQRLSNPITKLYLLFLDFVLPVFNKVNKLMQSESTQIHVLYMSVASTLRTILSCYMKESYLSKTPLKQLRFRDPNNFKPIEEMYLGVNVDIELRSSAQYEKVAIDRFRLNCLEFYIEAASQINKRFSFGSEKLEILKALSPKVVFNKEIPSLVTLLHIYSHIVPGDMQEVDTEWRILSNSSITLVDVDSTMKPEEFWSKVGKVNYMDNQPMVPHLSKFMKTLLCLPYSSTTVERLFSAINRMKTKTRNRLSTETLVGLLQTRQSLKGSSTCDFRVTKALLI